MKEITLIVKYSVKNGMVNDFLTALKNEGFPQIVQNENGCIKYDYFVPSFGKSNCRHTLYNSNDGTFTSM